MVVQSDETLTKFMLIVPLSSLLKNSARVYLDCWQNKEIFLIFLEEFLLKSIEKWHLKYVFYGKFNVNSKHKIDWKVEWAGILSFDDTYITLAIQFKLPFILFGLYQNFTLCIQD